MPGIGASDRAVAGVDGVVAEDVGPLEDEALALVDDLDDVRLHVDHGPLAAAVDGEHDDVVARPSSSRTASSSTSPRARSTTTGSVELDHDRRRVRAGAASRRPGTGGRCRAGDQHRAGPGREDPGRSPVGGSTVGVVQPGGVDGGVAELVAGGQRAQEADVGGQPEDRGVVERGDQRAAGGLAVGAVRDDLAEHRVVRRADDLAGLQGVVDPRAGSASGRCVAVPAWGRKPPNGSSA